MKTDKLIFYNPVALSTWESQSRIFILAKNVTRLHTKLFRGDF